MILKTFVCAFLAAGTLQAATLGLNDVSILLPLPTTQSNDRLFRPLAKGTFGELLPRNIYDLMPELLLETSEETFHKLRVVGIRLDPCFPTSAEATQCQPH